MAAADSVLAVNSVAVQLAQHRQRSLEDNVVSVWVRLVSVVWASAVVCAVCAVALGWADRQQHRTVDSDLHVVNVDR